jgi:ADP-ribosylglycohydrolase
MVEFQSSDAIARQYPAGLREIGPSPVWGTIAGQPTDDSEMALALARSMLPGGYDEEAAARAYGEWRQSEPFDIGNTTRQAVDAIVAAISKGESASEAARKGANPHSEANGALMRQSPLAIWGSWLDPDALDTFVRADTTLTHPSQVCQDASAAFIVALAATIREGFDGRAAYDFAREYDRTSGSSPSVTRALEAAADGPPEYRPREGHVLKALQNAFYQALHVPTLEEGVVATVMGGGDTDTNAAIAGALLGAIHGVDAIPAQWREAILNCRPEKGAPGVRRPRPEEYWPVDALELAERLFSAGRGSKLGWERLHDPRTTQDLIEEALRFEDRDDHGYWERVDVLWCRANLDTIEMAQQLCKSIKPGERMLGADILGQLGVYSQHDAFHEERLTILLDLLEQEQEAEVLSAACSALGHLGDPRAIGPVARLKGHADADVRHSVVFGLLGHEDEQALDTLIELSHDETSDVRDWATFGLGSQVDIDTPAIREALVARLTDPHRDTRGEAMVGLARRKDERVIGPLIAEIGSQEVGSLALDAAYEIADPRLCQALLALKADIGEDEELERALQSCNCHEP